MKNLAVDFIMTREEALVSIPLRGIGYEKLKAAGLLPNQAPGFHPLAGNWL
jgi:hypothetical protein